MGRPGWSAPCEKPMAGVRPAVGTATGSALIEQADRNAAQHSSENGCPLPAILGTPPTKKRQAILPAAVRSLDPDGCGHADHQKQRKRAER